jgi:hypothetical protein
MSIRKRKDQQGVKQTFHPRERKLNIDYDYINKLSLEELNWLGRFTFEYYGADFIINDTYLQQENGEFENITHMDLRKMRSKHKFYKTPEGGFSDDIKYKYSPKNIHPEKFWADLRQKCRFMRNDMMSYGFNHTNNRSIEELFRGVENIENVDPLRLIEMLDEWSCIYGEDFIDSQPD